MGKRLIARLYRQVFAAHAARREIERLIGREKYRTPLDKLLERTVEIEVESNAALMMGRVGGLL